MDISYTLQEKIREFLDDYLEHVPPQDVDTQDMADQIAALLEAEA